MLYKKRFSVHKFPKHLLEVAFKQHDNLIVIMKFILSSSTIAKIIYLLANSDPAGNLKLKLVILNNDVKK